MGLPIPGIFLYKEADTGRHLVVDGQQRLRTLQYFYSGLFLDGAFRLVGVREEWEGKTYSDLETSEQLRLDNSILHATIFQQDQPKDTRRSLYFVFERINSGGIRLSPQEIRNCISQSIVLDASRTLNDNPDWRAIFGKKKNTRLKDQELVLRALAMMHGRKNYAAQPMRDFLNTFASNENDAVDVKTIQKLRKDFQLSIAAINKSIGQSASGRAGRSMQLCLKPLWSEWPSAFKPVWRDLDWQSRGRIREAAGQPRLQKCYGASNRSRRPCGDTSTAGNRGIREHVSVLSRG